MRILAVARGRWGERKVDIARSRGPKDWDIQVWTPPRALPLIIDEPEEVLPPSLPPSDLVLYLGENPSLPQLLPAIVRATGARAVLAPIDSSAWFPTGLKNQIREELLSLGVGAVFPKPHCSLTPLNCGYGRAVETYDVPLVAEYARAFGHPQLSLQMDPESKTIQRADVFRSAPCGCTYFVGEKLAGVAAERAVLAPIDSSAWFPTGLKNQIREELLGLGVGAVFPKPHCSLTPLTCGYGRAVETYDVPLVAEYARAFGRPQLTLHIDPESKTIQRAEVLRSAPCGCTYFVGEKLARVSADMAVLEAGLLHHHYPCLASMAKEWIDDRLEDTLMHVAGFILQEEVAREVAPYRQVSYMVPGERAGEDGKV